jgi:CubicO group peptidase (beta-lactamase class C family)
MMLAEQGLLDVIQPVQKYIPEFTGTHKAKVRVWHLLTHTSGLRDRDAFEHIERKRKERSAPLPPCPATQHPVLHERLTLGYDTALWKEPGVEMSYCGAGYQLVAEIVRRLSGQSLDAFSKERLFEPLGMKDTHFEVPRQVWNRIVTYPEKPGASAWLNDPKQREIPYADGGLYSTVNDMAVFCQMYLNGGHYDGVRILSPTTIRYMTRNHLPGISAVKADEFFPEASWGIGWNIIGTKFDRGSLQSLQTYCHGGAGGVCIWIDPTYDVVGVYFSVGGTAQPSLYMNAINGAIVDI